MEKKAGFIKATTKVTRKTNKNTNQIGLFNLKVNLLGKENDG